MRLLRLATLVLALIGGSFGLFRAPASATPLSGAIAGAASSPLAENPLVQQSQYGYRRHHWRPRYHYRRYHWRPRHYYRRHYWRPRYHHRRHYWRRRYW